jgi:hypothetical protein
VRRSATLAIVRLLVVARGASYWALGEENPLRQLKPPKNSGPAHIHGVTCEEYRAMKDFDAQFATVEIGLTGFPVVACGNIPAG